MALSENIRIMRESRGLSQSELAERIGLQKQKHISGKQVLPAEPGNGARNSRNRSGKIRKYAHDKV